MKTAVVSSLKNRKNFIEARVNPRGLLFAAYCTRGVTDKMLGRIRKTRRSFGEIKHFGLPRAQEGPGIVVTRGR